MPALGQALDEFFTEHKLPRRGIRLGIGTNRVGVRTLDVEGIDDERQLGNAVRFRAHEALSIPIDQAVLDYHVIGETIDESGGCTVAARGPCGCVSRADRPLHRGLSAREASARRNRPRGLRALARCCARDVERPTGAAALVALSLGHDRSTLAISDGSICDFTRVLEWGGGKLETAIGRDLGLTGDEAADLKHQVSLEPEAVESDDPRVAARAHCRPARGSVARTRARRLASVLPNPTGLSSDLAEILVTGGTSQLPGLVEELERLTRARVRAADPLSGRRSCGGASVSETTSPRWRSRLDLGLNADASRQPSSRVRTARTSLDVRRQRAVVSAHPADRRHGGDWAGCDLRALLLPRADSRERQEERARNGSRRGWSPSRRAPSRSSRRRQASQARLAFMHSDHRRPRSLGFGDGRPRPCASDRRRRSTTSRRHRRRPRAHAAPASATVTISGNTNSHVRVALILDRLALLPWLSGIALQSTSRSGNTVSFSIGATLRRRR